MGVGGSNGGIILGGLCEWDKVFLGVRSDCLSRLEWMALSTPLAFLVFDGVFWDCLMFAW